MKPGDKARNPGAASSLRGQPAPKHLIDAGASGRDEPAAAVVSQADDRPFAPTPAHALTRLLQLVSPTLPVGAYSYSQGLEWVVETGTVHDAVSARAWIGDLLEHVVARGEASVFARLINATYADERGAFVQWNSWFRVSRETRELQAETTQMGGALVKLARDLHFIAADRLEWLADCEPVTFPAAFALAAHAGAIAPADALTGYLFAWLENQVLAAMKLVPLGQVAGQQMLHTLGARIPAVVDCAMALPEIEIASFAPGLGIASARHETQYTRLFRS
jgi:urease accessory protein